MKFCYSKYSSSEKKGHVGIILLLEVQVRARNWNNYFIFMFNEIKIFLYQVKCTFEKYLSVYMSFR